MKHRKIGVFLAPLSLLLILACSLPEIPRFNMNPSGGPSGRIIYVANESGNWEIYLMDLLKNKSIRLTNNTAEDYSPAYIPALSKIGFVSDRGNGINVYTMNLDGSEQEVLFDKKVSLDYPDWSPDGKLIAASYNEPCKENSASCFFDLYILDPVGFKTTQLSKTKESEWVPQWSPDGQKIAFASDRNGDSEIYVINKDGSNLVQLTKNTGYDGRPRWSPDGLLIAFETDREGGDWDIFIMNADGSDPHAITSNTFSSDWMQSWSPDGKWLVYVSSKDGNNELYIIDINGQNQRVLTRNAYSDNSPVWIP